MQFDRQEHKDFIGQALAALTIPAAVARLFIEVQDAVEAGEIVEPERKPRAVKDAG